MSDDKNELNRGADTLLQLKQLFFENNDQNEHTLNMLAGFSKEELDATYAVACQKLNVGDLETAGKLFFMLCILKHNESKHWRGMGLCMHRQKNYQLADFLYGFALLNDPQDVISRTFRAEVLMWQNLRVRATQEALRAIEDGKKSNKKEFVSYVQRAETILATLRAEDSGAEFEPK